MTRNLVINSGNWAKDDTGKLTGNFRGYNTKGENVHIYGALMNSLGFKTGEAVKLPLYVIASNKEYSKLDDQGKEIPGSEFVRLTAGAVFTSPDSLAAAHVADKALDVQVRKAIKSSAKDAGLTEDEAAELLANAL
jgi:hypothetical protein